MPVNRISQNIGNTRSCPSMLDPARWKKAIASLRHAEGRAHGNRTREQIQAGFRLSEILKLPNSHQYPTNELINSLNNAGITVDPDSPTLHYFYSATYVRIWLEWIPEGKTHHSLLFGLLSKNEKGSVKALKALLLNKRLVDAELSSERDGNLSFKSKKGFDLHESFSEEVKFGDVNERRNINALHKAILLNNPGAVRLLLNAGADPYRTSALSMLDISTEDSSGEWLSQEEIRASRSYLTPLQLVDKLASANPNSDFGEVKSLLIDAKKNPPKIESMDKASGKNSTQIQQLFHRLYGAIKRLLTAIFFIPGAIICVAAFLAISPFVALAHYLGVIKVEMPA